MNLDLSDEQRLIEDTARQFADEVIAPRIRASDRECRFDTDLARRLGEMGYLGAPVAERYGGRGLDFVTFALIIEQIGRTTAPPERSSRFRRRSSAGRSSAGGRRSRSSGGSPASAAASGSAASA